MEDSFNKYPYLNILIKINAGILDMIPGKNLRLKKEEDLKEMNNKIKDFFILSKSVNDVDKDINKIIESILNLTGYLKLIQPFYDGNNRTLNYFLEIFFAVINYDIDTDIKKHSSIIPVFYEEDEQCLDYHIDFCKKYLTKK